MPFVREEICETAAEREAVDETSSERVSMEVAFMALSLLVLRAEAKTRQPAAWKARARAEPRPPSEEPVMRTVRWGAIAVYKN